MYCLSAKETEFTRTTAKRQKISVDWELLTRLWFDNKIIVCKKTQVNAWIGKARKQEQVETLKLLAEQIKSLNNLHYTQLIHSICSIDFSSSSPIVVETRVHSNCKRLLFSNKVDGDIIFPTSTNIYIYNSLIFIYKISLFYIYTIKNISFTQIMFVKPLFIFNGEIRILIFQRYCLFVYLSLLFNLL